MLIGVVSDTHGHTRNTLAAVRMLEEFSVELVIHCGDVGTPELVGHFATWPTHFVLGNVDDPTEIRRAIKSARQSCHDWFGELTLADTKIAFLHGDDSKKLADAIDGGSYGLVCHGHTHVARQEWIGDTLVLNPGALYRTNRLSLAVVDLPARQVTDVAL
ncbi:MAG: metallophosphoesterase family protein [Pirellulales bacterium]